MKSKYSLHQEMDELRNVFCCIIKRRQASKPGTSTISIIIHLYEHMTEIQSISDNSNLDKAKIPV